MANDCRVSVTLTCIAAVQAVMVWIMPMMGDEFVYDSTSYSFYCFTLHLLLFGWAFHFGSTFIKYACVQLFQIDGTWFGLKSRDVCT